MVKDPLFIVRKSTDDVPARANPAPIPVELSIPTSEKVPALIAKLPTCDVPFAARPDPNAEANDAV
jgi:hypothetical protein